MTAQNFSLNWPSQCRRFLVVHSNLTLSLKRGYLLRPKRRVRTGADSLQKTSHQNQQRLLFRYKIHFILVKLNMLHCIDLFNVLLKILEINVLT